jgi:DNA-binding MarR family transcriptional regulator
MIQTSLDIQDPELEILQSIHARAANVRQRDLAKIVGLSLGMTNSILKRLVEKGWLSIRKVNNRNIRYAVSPAGLDQITRRSYQYFKRTIKNIVVYREAIERFILTVASGGFHSLMLVGRSDLDFIVEHACRTNGVVYVRDDRNTESFEVSPDALFILYAESYVPDEEEKSSRKNTAFLQDVVIRGENPRA